MDADGLISAPRLAPHPEGGQFQSVVPPGVWQSAVSIGPWTLVGWMVAPAFGFAGFELASRDWTPNTSGELG